MKSDYWTQFWIDHSAKSAGLNPQSQVLRTLHGEPIPADTWQSTIGYITEKLSLSSGNRVLDLCGGNGLVAQAMAGQGHDVVVVDISENLLRNIDEQFEKITTIQADMRSVEFDHESFDRIVCYAAIQYLSLAETTALFAKLVLWLTPGGMLFVGDIPDSSRRWDFFDSAERRSNYFTQLAAGRPIVGTWFDKNWMTYLAEHVGFHSIELTDQPDWQIYSWFRFDMRCRK